MSAVKGLQEKIENGIPCVPNLEIWVLISKLKICEKPFIKEVYLASFTDVSQLF